MSRQRRVPWDTALRDLSNDRAKIPAGLLAARTAIHLTVRYDRRPLFVTGKFGRAAIMRAAAKAAHLHQARFGCSWTATLYRRRSRPPWSAAKVARHMATL